MSEASKSTLFTKDPFSKLSVAQCHFDLLPKVFFFCNRHFYYKFWDYNKYCVKDQSILKDPTDSTQLNLSGRLIILTDPKIMAHSFMLTMLTEYKSEPLSSRISSFTSYGNANVLEHMPVELLHVFDLSGRTFNETVQLIYQDNAFYCFLSSYIYAHHTKSSHVMTNKFNIQDQWQRKYYIASQLQSMLSISPLELIV